MNSVSSLFSHTLAITEPLLQDQTWIQPFPCPTMISPLHSICFLFTGLMCRPREEKVICQLLVGMSTEPMVSRTKWYLRRIQCPCRKMTCRLRERTFGRYANDFTWALSAAPLTRSLLPKKASAVIDELWTSTVL